MTEWGQSVVYNLRYPGQYFDSETSLNYNYFREYDPVTGRYMESDPLLHAPAGFVTSPVSSNKFLVKYPQLLSSYSYVADSPVKGVDPYGLGPLEWLKKLFESTKCAKAINAVRQAAAKCDRACPANADLEMQAEFIEQYSNDGSLATAITGCVCHDMPEVCAEALTCGFKLIY